MSCSGAKHSIMNNIKGCYMDDEELELWLNNKRIERQLKKDFKDSQTVNILLLGTGEAGKSTFIKQMKILHGQKFTEAELNDYRIDLMNNVVDSMKTMIKGMEQLQIAYEVDKGGNDSNVKLISFL